MQLRPSDHSSKKPTAIDAQLLTDAEHGQMLRDRFNGILTRGSVQELLKALLTAAL